MQRPCGVRIDVVRVAEAVWQDEGRVSGAVCFRGTRLPVHVLFDYLLAGQTVAEFLDDYPGPSEEQVNALLGACQRLADKASQELLAA